MDYNNIDKLLEKYFEGLTSLEEEQILQRYFSTEDIPDRYIPYKPIFKFYDKQRKVTNPSAIRLERKHYSRNYKLGIAATLLIGLSLFWLFNNNSSKKNNLASKNNEKEKVIKEMKVYSKNINESLKNVSALSIFGKTTQKIFVVKRKDSSIEKIK